MGEKITIRFDDEEFAQIAVAASSTGLPVTTYTKLILKQALQSKVMQDLFARQENILNRHEKFLTEILRREVLGAHLLYNKDTQDVSSRESKEFIAKFIAALDQED